MNPRTRWIALAIVTVLAFVLASRLRVSGDLTALFPNQGDASALSRYTRAFGGGDAARYCRIVTNQLRDMVDDVCKVDGRHIGANVVREVVEPVSNLPVQIGHQDRAAIVQAGRQRLEEI